VSPGCDRCWAAAAVRGGAAAAASGLVGVEGGWTGEIRFDERSLATPLRWRKPAWVVLGSLCDLFHPRVAAATIEDVLGVVASTPWLTYRVLTKRTKRMLHLGNEGLQFPPNLWLGVSVESDEFAWRAEDLLRVNAHSTWVSVEPMIGPVPSLAVATLGWVVCAPESGEGARPLEADWVRALRDDCVAEGVPFRYGSLGDCELSAGVPAPDLPLLDGVVWDQGPLAE